ncbi:hypothetical protein GCM10025857_09220 [Alicyclobacillus contaminans]|uniref:hypothetical protein n=1 Tax=Alicyclobacillus contaminans TaxID=392016 RepID=UPI0003F92637|nr:hypothetical protein [Alicyclobacillus contaminans]GMA49565.1 hypothetical protein GCM10025857_09220 [Alicyclobacillus contaminans]
MTTRFGLDELAEMLHTPVAAVRAAVDDLAARGELTAESFVYGDKNWRIAPSDTKRIQSWIEEQVRRGQLSLDKPTRRVVRKVRVTSED